MGLRMQFHIDRKEKWVKIFTEGALERKRKGIERSKFLPDLVEEALEKLRADNCILDAEVVWWKEGKPLPRHEMVAMGAGKEPIRGEDIRANVFDIQWFNGQDISVSKDYTERLKILEEVIPKGLKHFFVVDTVAVKTKEEFYETYQKLSTIVGSEGVMLKTPAMPGFDPDGRTTHMCLPPGSLIFTNHLAKPIETVEAGDSVFCEHGTTKVVAKVATPFSGELLKFHLGYFPPLQLTPEHRVLVLRDARKKYNRWCGRQYRRKVDGCDTSTRRTTRCELRNAKLCWVEARDVKIGDALVFPQYKEHKRRTRETEWITDELAELLGWYAAEGFILNNRYFAIGLGKNGGPIIEHLKEVACRIFPPEQVLTHFYEKSCRLLIRNKSLIDFARKHIGEQSDKKFISHHILDMPKERLQIFLDAYFAGDGTKYGQAATKSPSLAFGIVLACSKLGFVPSWRQYGKRQLWILSKPQKGSLAARNPENCRWRIPMIRGNKLSERFWFPLFVQRIERIPYTGPVFHLETKRGTFLAPVVVHNSKIKTLLEYDLIIIGMRKVPAAKPPKQRFTEEQMFKMLPELLEKSKTYVFRVGFRGPDGKIWPIFADRRIMPGDLNLKWDEERQRWCLPYDHPVYTLEEGVKPFGALRVGERILSPEGFTEIKQIMKFPGDRLIRISIPYIGEIKVTPEHRLLVSRNFCWLRSKRTKRQLAPPVWLEAKALVPGDALLMPSQFPVLETECLPPDFYELVGWYLSEGSEANGEVSIYQSASSPFIEEIRDLVQRLLPKDRFREKLSGRKWCITIKRSEVANWLVETFGRFSHSKRIPSEIVFGLPREHSSRLITAFLKGDGNKTVRGNNQLNTTSKKLAHDLFWLLARLGYMPALYERKRNGKPSLYRVCFWPRNASKRHGFSFFEMDGFYFLPIKKIEVIEDENPVFHIETVSGHFLMPVISHNSGTEGPAAGWKMMKGFPHAKRGEYGYGVTYVYKSPPGVREPRLGDIITVKPILVRAWKDEEGNVRISHTFPRVLALRPEKREPDDWRVINAILTAVARRHGEEPELLLEKRMKAVVLETVFPSPLLMLEPVELKEGLISPLGSPMGKHFMVPKLLEMMPPHRVYTELFAGAGALFWEKPNRAVKEIINDLDEDTYFAWKFIQNITEDQVKSLKRRNWIPSRERFERIKNWQPQDPVDRFYRLAYLWRHSFNRAMVDYCPSRARARKWDYPEWLDRWEEYKWRLENVQIYNQDALELFPKVDDVNVFHYLDPPYLYLPGKRSSWYVRYKTKLPYFTEEQFMKLRDLLAKAKGLFILSLGESPIMKRIFKDFYLSYIYTFRGASSSEKEPRYSRRELIVSNFPVRWHQKREAFEDLVLEVSFEEQNFQ